MTDICLHFICAHYRLYGNAPVVVAVVVAVASRKACRASAQEVLKEVHAPAADGAVTARQRAATGLGLNVIERSKCARARTKLVEPLALNSASVIATPKCSCKSQQPPPSLPSPGGGLSAASAISAAHSAATMKDDGATSARDAAENEPFSNSSAHGRAAAGQLAAVMGG